MRLSLLPRVDRRGHASIETGGVLQRLYDARRRSALAIGAARDDTRIAIGTVDVLLPERVASGDESSDDLAARLTTRGVVVGTGGCGKLRAIGRTRGGDRGVVRVRQKARRRGKGLRATIVERGFARRVARHG